MTHLKQYPAKVFEWMTSRKHSVLALSALRMMVGLLGLAFYLVEYGNRHLFFGATGIYTHARSQSRVESSGTWSLYLASDSPAYFEVVYHLGIAVAALVALGVGGRFILLAHYVFIWSLYMMNPLLLDGGDNIIMIVGLVLLLTRCFDYLTIWNSKKSAKKHSVLGNITHNTGVLLVGAQICIVYLMAGMYKIQGQLWQDGTALYYILRTPEFYFPGVTDLSFRFDWLLVLSTYMTVLLSVYFPLLILFPATRLFAVLAMAAFHLGTAVMMGLTSFALIMIACDLIFVDKHIWSLRRRVSTMINRPSRRFRPQEASPVRRRLP